MGVRSGDVLAGKYQVERVLGQGGMGVVVAARHLQLGQMMALKFLRPEALATEEALGRFLREARNAVQLKSEHVARVIDVGTLDDGAPFIVMEYLEGEDLGQLLARRGPLPITAAVDFVLQACDAIAEAHSLGIVHRDLKPQNLFAARRNDGTCLVKVLDFGISKSIQADLVATGTQLVIGTPAYMSPEQMRSSKQVDARTDVWALGIILHELVVGRPPWDAESFTSLCFKVAMDPLPPLPPELQHNGFQNVLRCCLEKEPAYRFPSIYALASALSPFSSPESRRYVASIGRMSDQSAVSPALTASAISEVSGTLREAVGQQLASASRRSRTLPVIGMVATSAVAVLVTLVLALSGDGQGSVRAGKAPVLGAPAPIAQPTKQYEAAPSVAPPVLPSPAPVTSLPSMTAGEPMPPAIGTDGTSPQVEDRAKKRGRELATPVRDQSKDTSAKRTPRRSKSKLDLLASPD